MVAYKTVAEYKRNAEKIKKKSLEEKANNQPWTQPKSATKTDGLHQHANHWRQNWKPRTKRNKGLSISRQYRFEMCYGWQNRINNNKVGDLYYSHAKQKAFNKPALQKMDEIHWERKTTPIEILLYRKSKKEAKIESIRTRDNINFRKIQVTSLKKIQIVYSDIRYRDKSFKFGEHTRHRIIFASTITYLNL